MRNKIISQCRQVKIIESRILLRASPLMVRSKKDSSAFKGSSVTMNEGLQVPLPVGLYSFATVSQIGNDRRQIASLYHPALNLVDCPIPAGERGMYWEADEAARCVRDGKLESEGLPWEESIVIMQTMDEIRKQHGLVYPEKIESIEYPVQL